MKAYKRILVPTDGTKLSLKAAKEAAALAKDLKAEITAVYVMPPWIPPMMVDGTGLPAEAFDERAFIKATEAIARIALDKVQAAASAAKVACDGVALRENEPWRGIVRTAKSKKCDLIVMASHGRTGVAAVILGSETRKVLAHATKPVLICR
jgi:nucleotide-binding universal stress UspA family protein